MPTGSARTWPPAQLVRALLAVVSLVGQLALGSMVLPDAASARPVAELDAVAILCMSGTATPARHHRHPVDRTLGQIAAALSLPAVLLLPSVALPPPTATSGRYIAAIPPARGPPQSLAWALHVRGPPSLA